MVEKMLSKSVSGIFVGGLAIGAGWVAQPALAQTQAAAEAPMQRVEITGSSIKRIAAEGALPVTVVNAAAIKASGVTSAADLVKRLVATQGATGESGSVGGSSYGFSGISVHNVGETRTLVLLNGKRLAQFGGQTLTGFAAGFDLNSIPLSAIERVELLTDGASALYGADAIAGVVNFITKHNSTEGDVTLGYSKPADGAQEKRISATKGFGSLDEDGYNVMLTFGHDERTKLGSGDRDFAKTGTATFSANGKQYRKQQFSENPIPANVRDDVGQLVSPYRMKNGVCPAKTFRVVQPFEDEDGVARVSDYCGYDFVGDLQIYPERKRDSFMASLTAKLAGQELFADVLLSRTSQVSRIAPVPGSISIPAGSDLHNQYLLPLGITQNTSASYRLFDMGQRTSRDKAEFASIVGGVRGEVLGWDYSAAYNFSQSDVKGSISGYPGALAVGKLTSGRLLDPFVGPGQQSAEALAAIKNISYSGYFDGGTSTLHSLNLNGSRTLAQLPGGAMMLGVGASLTRENFANKPSLFAQGKLADPVKGTLCDGDALPCDPRFGDAADSLAYEAGRTSKGVFGELVMPVAKTLELGAALRLDDFSDFGNATTAKASFRWTPLPTLMLRGSVGNGFHAPTVPQVKAKLQGYGVTSSNYTCTPALRAVAAAHNAVCKDGDASYDQLAAGNPELKPEKSKQATFGVRFEPLPALSLGADLWHVQIRDTFGQLTEDVVFANPANFANSWGSKTEAGTGVNYLAFLADNQNLGKSYATGIDIDITGRLKTGFGQLISQLNVTHMLRETSQLEKDGEYFSALGNLAELGTVTFRTQGRLATTLKTGNWTNTLGLNFKSGYKDIATEVDVLDAGGNVAGTEEVRVKVGYFSTWDWQTQWANKNWSVSAGILNVFDRDPPFVPSDAGSNRGQQFGYDDRYYDSRGRTLYANASYKF